MEKQKPRVAKTILYNKGTGITIPDFYLYYRAILIIKKKNIMALAHKQTR